MNRYAIAKKKLNNLGLDRILFIDFIIVKKYDISHNIKISKIPIIGLIDWIDNNILNHFFLKSLHIIFDNFIIFGVEKPNFYLFFLSIEVINKSEVSKK